MDGSRSAKTVYLHVGAPTAGAAFLQRALWDNRRRLGDDGVCYPIVGPMEHFGAVMDLREMTWGGHRDPAWEGAFDKMAQRAREWDGPTVVFSQELLGGASEQHVKQAVAAFEPAEVHVLFTTRDLGWQLIFDWQEQVRHTHTISFERFVGDLVEQGIHAPEPYGEMFWGLHDPIRVLGTWEKAVPADRIHVLTLPPPGESPGLLWTRFCALTGIDPGRYDVSGIPEQTPLSVIEAELLRRLNEKIPSVLGGEYERVVRDYLIGHGLSEGADETRRPEMGMPARHAAWAAERTREIAETIRARYRVHGDLEELTTPRHPEASLMPGDVPDEEIATASIGVISHLLRRLAESRERIGLAHLQAEMTGMREDLSQLLKAAANPSPGLQRAARRATGRGDR